MIRKITDKRGVSLMVSYVILISIAIGLSIGVYVWLKDYAQLNEKIDCKEGTSLILEDYNVGGGNTISLDVKNNGLFSIDGFILTVSNSSLQLPITLLHSNSGEKLGHYDFLNPLKPGITENGILFFKDSDYDVKVMQIQPYIYEDGKKIVCENAVIKQDVFESPFSPLSLPGLISWWSFDGDFNDGAGSNDGSCTNCPTQTEDRHGNADSAYLFDGDDDYIEVLDTSNINFGEFNDFSITGWFNTTADLPTFLIIKGDEYLNQSYSVRKTGGNKLAFTVADDTSDKTVYSDNNVNDGDWHFFVAIAKRDGNASLYIDGQLQIDQTDISGLGEIDSLNNLTIGANHIHTQHWNGSIDDVMIFNRALYTNEIEDLAEGNY